MDNIMDNILTGRELQILTRFVKRCIIRMDDIKIPEEESKHGGKDMYLKVLECGKKEIRVCMYLIDSEYQEYDEQYDEGKQQYIVRITLQDVNKLINTKAILNRHLTIEDWYIFHTEILKSVVCGSCNGYFIAEAGMEYCDKCDPYVMTHTEDCSICLSNKEAVWVKTPCNHCFHYECINKVESKYVHGEGHQIKCPLCRTIVLWKQYNAKM